MIKDVLELNGISEDILKELSYKSKLGKSLKQNLHAFARDDLLAELYEVSRWLNQQEILSDMVLDYRVKSYDSITQKYERYYPNRQVMQVFNDILGFRAFCDGYEDLLAAGNVSFRVADMSKGKAHDDGYRGVHLYYQPDNFHYPIDIQFNTLYDRQINNWLHIFLYKKNYPDIIGQKMRERYEAGDIRSDHDFKDVLRDVLYTCERY